MPEVVEEEGRAAVGGRGRDGDGEEETVFIEWGSVDLNFEGKVKEVTDVWEEGILLE
jgi:hypothetical protein